MEAGRELDALVAEKVMAWRTGAVPSAFIGFRLTWVDADTGGYRAELGWAPSTDIAAAYTVVSEMMRQGYRLEVIWDSYDADVELILETCEGYQGGGKAVADGLPLAICLAALSAKAVDIG